MSNPQGQESGGSGQSRRAEIPQITRLKSDYFMICLIFWIIAIALVGDSLPLNILAAVFGLLGVGLFFFKAVRRLSVSDLIEGEYLTWNDIDISDRESQKRLTSIDWTNLGYAAHHEKAFDRAAEAFSQAATTAKHDIDWLHLSQTYERLGDTKSAEAARLNAKKSENHPV